MCSKLDFDNYDFIETLTFGTEEYEDRNELEDKVYRQELYIQSLNYLLQDTVDENESVLGIFINNTSSSLGKETFLMKAREKYLNMKVQIYMFDFNNIYQFTGRIILNNKSLNHVERMMMREKQAFTNVTCTHIKRFCESVGITKFVMYS